MTFTDGHIDGVVIRDLVSHNDKRGWLIELFRSDEIDGNLMPVMGYISSTEPGVARGPHEHRDQTDCFCFIGPSMFRLYLWDNRKNSPTYAHRMVFEAGESQPRMVIIPGGIVHGYLNVGSIPGWVVNLPNRLFAGRDRSEEVDEIRHEQDPNSVFKME